MNMTEKYAYLNWRMNRLDRSLNYGAMAEGYWKAAVKLLDSLLDDNSAHDADAIIFPVLFDAHQALELYLKATKIVACEVKGTNPWLVSLPSVHDLIKITSSLNSVFDNDDDALLRNGQTEDFFKLADLLESIGSDGQGGYYVDFARYPERDSEHQYMFVESDRLVCNLFELRGLIDSGCSFMDGFYWFWQDRADSVRDMKPDMCR